VGSNPAIPTNFLLPVAESLPYSVALALLIDFIELDQRPALRRFTAFALYNLSV
jgi:hypothetical protein